MEWGYKDMVDKVRNIFLLITAFITIMTVILKTSNELFMEMVKAKYKNIPGGQTVTETIVKGM